jgi:hypothetical protein
MTYHEGAAGGVWLLALLNGSRDLREAMPLNRFRFRQDGTDPNLYEYRFWLTDGRQWRQNILFASAEDGDPTMTFNVSDGWRLGEFAPQRTWRQLMVTLRTELNATEVRIDAAA